MNKRRAEARLEKNEQLRCNKRAWFSALFGLYVRRRLRRQFAAIGIAGLARLQEQAEAGPLILACNHVAWWDPLLLVHLDALVSRDAVCLMDAENLNKLPFFSWLGAVPLDRSSDKKAYRDLLRAGTWLSRPGRVLIIFPQGRQRPAHLDLDLKLGVEILAKKTNCPVVPMAIRYDFREEPKLEANLSVGEALHYQSDAQGVFLKRLDEALRDELARIDAHLLSPRPEFDSLLSSASTRLPTGTRALALLTKGRQT